MGSKASNSQYGKALLLLISTTPIPDEYFSHETSGSHQGKCIPVSQEHDHPSQHSACIPTFLYEQEAELFVTCCFSTRPYKISHLRWMPLDWSFIKPFSVLESINQPKIMTLI